MKKWLIRLFLIIFVIVITFFVYRVQYTVYETKIDSNHARYLTLDGVNYYQAYADWEVNSNIVDKKLGYLDSYKDELYAMENDSKMCAVRLRNEFFQSMEYEPFYREDIYNKKLCRGDVDSAVLAYNYNDSDKWEEKQVKQEAIDELFLYLEGKKTLDISKEEKTQRKHFSLLRIYCYNDELENIKSIIRLDDRGKLVVANINSFGDKNILIPKQLILDIYNG